MSASGYEIRHSLLCEARGMAYEQWHAAMSIEQRTAELENRAPKHISAPSVDEIKKIAESMYEFVQHKG